MSDRLGKAIDKQQGQRGGDQPQTVGQMLERMGPEFAKVLPKQVPPETFMRLALTEIRKKPELSQCTPASLAGALITAAALGLEPGGPLQQFHLIPMRLKGVWTVVPMIGYKGLRDLALRGGQVESIQSYVIREGDDFRFGGNEMRGAWFNWEPEDIDSDRPMMGILTVAQLPGAARPVWRYLTKQQVEKRRDAGAAKGSGFWSNWPEEMARKTGIRSIANDLPSSSVLALATAVDEQVQVWREGDEAPRAAAREIEAAPEEGVRHPETAAPDVPDSEPTEETPEVEDGFFEPKG